MKSLSRLPLAALILFGSLEPAFAQLDADDFPPGLLAKYSAGGKTVERVDHGATFHWEAGPPDPRLPAGPFEAEWTGRLLIKKSSDYTFHAFHAGDVTLEIDGKTRLAGKADSPRWLSGEPVELGSGFRSVRLRFRANGKQPRLHLFWTAERFPLEPLPENLLFLPAGESPDDRNRVERGRVLFDVSRCNRCHVREHDPQSPPGPDLSHVVTNLSAAELQAKIRNPKHNAPHAKMPAFGFDDDEAVAVAAFLRSASKPVKLKPLPRPRRKKGKNAKNAAAERRSGQILVRSVGCLACHSLGERGDDGPYSGGDLTRVAKQRSPEWLNQWLDDPAKLNRDHRMPVFKLSNEERREIVLFLSNSSPDEKAAGNDDAPNAAAKAKTAPAADSAERVALGKRLVERARCAACHTIPGVKFTPAGLADLSRPVNDDDSCLQDKPNPKTGRPAYSGLDAAAVRAYLAAHAGTLSPLSRSESGRRVLERRNCTGCHDRGPDRGIVETAGTMSKLDPTLGGQSETMIPPSLNAVGDKLLDDYLKTAVAGKQKSVRMPWLRVRMPRFDHSETESAALTSHLISHDRIPDGGPVRAKPRPEKMPAESQVLVAGQTLLGIGGFSCIACHKVGEYEPRNTAPGTRGSDLMDLAGRMRESFFERWTRAPIRIVPGMEMPSYHTKPVPGVLNDDVDVQLAVLWRALNDERFKPPTNPSVVEQFLTVKPGDPARIVRDVFKLSKENGGGYVARSLAIGLNNGHNLLFDLDTYSLRGWYFGDFARQRTEGKSWHWEMAGVPVMTGFRPGLDIAILPEKGKSRRLIFPIKHRHMICRPAGYGSVKRELVVVYNFWFKVAGKTERVDVTEVIKPLHPSKTSERSGWQRDIVVHGESMAPGFGNRVTGDHHVLISRPKASSGIGSPKIEAVERFEGKWETYPAITDREFIKMGVSAPGGSLGPTGRTITLRYTAKLKREQSKIELKAKVVQLQPEPLKSVPGFTAIRLPISRSIMPTAMTWLDDGRLAFTSLKGHVFISGDGDSDVLEDHLRVFEEGLAAPYGIIAKGKELVVSHKPEVILLKDRAKDNDPDDGRADSRGILATGWGYTDNYHDWTCGIVRDKDGNLYVGLGSDYAQPRRPKEHSRWRGKVLRIAPDGKITPVGHAFRYPTGLAMNHAGDVFVSDNQGVQNTFNEINHLKDGRHYGVPSRHEENPKAATTPPAIQIPHPWTRSVNGIFFLPKQPPKTREESTHFVKEFAGHGIGCEYDNRFLIRFSLQKVDGEYQGACYPFSKPDAGAVKSNFTGPLCGGVAPDGAIYIGSIHDSGWLGGRNTGDIVRLVPNGKLPNGIRELRATKDGFEIDFIRPVDRKAASNPENYTINGYTREWKGSYSTPDSGRHTLAVKKAVLSPDGKTVQLTVPNRRAGGYLYEVGVGKIGSDSQPELWPATGYYTMHRIPKQAEGGAP